MNKKEIGDLQCQNSSTISILIRLRLIFWIRQPLLVLLKVLHPAIHGQVVAVAAAAQGQLCQTKSGVDAIYFRSKIPDCDIQSPWIYADLQRYLFAVIESGERTMNSRTYAEMENFDLSDFENLEISILDTSATAGFPEGAASSRSWPTCSCSCSCPEPVIPKDNKYEDG